MFLCRRIPSIWMYAAGFHRNQVTISWPIQKGHDFLAWNRLANWFLLDMKDSLEYHQSSKPYQLDYNSKVRAAKENVAKIMGIDPKHFSDSELKLSLLYLLPSDIQRQEYKPHIPNELPVQSFLDIISQYDSSQLEKTALQKSNFSSLRKEIRLVHSIVLDALKQIETAPGLELFINPDEVVLLDENEADLNVLSDDATHETIDEIDSPIIENEAELFDDLSDTDNAPLTNDLEPSEESSYSEPEESDVDLLPALRMFPFVPVKSGNGLENNTLELQFNRLNHLIQDRPDLIKMYYPAIKHIVQDQSVFEKEGSQMLSDKQASDSSVTVFRGKVNRIFLFHSVVTTVVPGSGKISINNQSYLDFFPEVLSRMIVISPLRVSRTLGVFDINVEVDQEDPEKVHSLAHCIAMSIADCIKMYCPELKKELQVVYKRQFRVEYKKAHKKNSRRRYKWRKR